jgi:hypothetical protein
MSDILQTYHATSDDSRGIHAFTTSNPFEALALSNALQLRALVGSFLKWSDLIAESVEQTHGAGKVTELIRNDLEKLAALFDQAGGQHRG